jgi:type IV pilus assembly protein PilV
VVTASGSIPPTRDCRGSTIIEVLVALLVIAVGLLGIAGLQSRLVVSEVEAYQRSQALILLNDMVNRIYANRTNAASYVYANTSPIGSGMTCPSGGSTTAERDLSEWCNALQGASETIGGTKQGAAIGARGCVVQRTGTTVYDVSVAWQGLTAMKAPTNSDCGKNAFDSSSSGSPCVNDLCRRVVTVQVSLGNLAPP